MSVVKEMWSKVGVDLEIQIREQVVYQSISSARSFTDLYYGMTLGSGVYANMVSFRGTSMFNRSYWDDPTGKDPQVEAAYAEIQKNLFTNDAKTRQTIPGTHALHSGAGARHSSAQSVPLPVLAAMAEELPRRKHGRLFDGWRLDNLGLDGPDNEGIDDGQKVVGGKRRSVEKGVPGRSDIPVQRDPATKRLDPVAFSSLDGGGWRAMVGSGPGPARD